MKIEFDADEGTLSYTINDTPQGVCFKGLKGKTLFPAVCFYSSDRTISIVRCVAPHEKAGSSAEAAVAAAEAALKAGASVAAAAAAAAAVATGAPEAVLSAVVPGAVAAAAVAATAVAPVPPVLSPDDDEAAQRARHPGVELLCEMGFHWSQAVLALGQTGDNVEAAADRLLSGAVGTEVIEATELRIAKFAEEMAAYAVKKAEFEEKTKPVEATAAAAEADVTGLVEADVPPLAPLLLAQGSITGVERESTAAAIREEFESMNPQTRLGVVCALLYRLQELAGAYTPSLDASASVAGSRVATPVTARSSAPTARSTASSIAGGVSAGAVAATAAAPTVSLQTPVVESQLQAITLEEPFALQATGGNLIEVCGVGPSSPHPFTISAPCHPRLHVLLHS